MRQARERTGRTTGDVGGKKGRKEGETTFETVEAAQEAVARRQEGPKEEEPLARTQDSGLRRAVRETGGRGSAGRCLALLPPAAPASLCSHAPSCSWAGWLVGSCSVVIMPGCWMAGCHPPSNLTFLASLA
ncbi:hypothetical protein Landi51_05465 [Colletotrichum acutatum]